jgi:threonine dehydratase
MASHDYLKKTLTARVYDVARETELERAPHLSARLRNPVYLKREDNQPVFSFKVRGAYNKMAHMSADALARGVITASAGNHAQGVALSAARMGVKAIIVVPVTTPQVKVDAVRAHGGPTVEVVQFGESFSDAYGHAVQLQKERDLTFVHPFDDPYVIAGQGTVAMEILSQHQGPIHAIFVPIGGGGLAAGLSAVVKELRPEVRIVGVEPDDSDAMTRSLAAGRRVVLDHVGRFADGVAVRQVGAHTFELCRRPLDDALTVTTDEICAAIKDVFEETRTVLEPSGAVALAGLKRAVEQERVPPGAVVVIASGANMNFTRLGYVTERAEIGEHREAILAVTIPERAGSFLEFCRTIGERSVTEFNYRLASRSEAHVFVGLEVSGRAEAAEIAATLAARGYACTDLGGDDLAKTHVRHMVGGRSPAVANEVLYSFEFPERPGALIQFLTSLGSRWNISLFHYRNNGAAYGRVLCGFEVPAAERADLAATLSRLGFRCSDETDNAAARFFLR